MQRYVQVDLATKWFNNSHYKDRCMVFIIIYTIFLQNSNVCVI